jgi:transcriptional regulator with XRE-family HTH domain
VSADRKPNSQASDSAAIGRRIRQERERQGWSQLRLAVEAGLIPNTIWRLERGKGEDPRLSTLRSIADALGVKLTDLLEPKPNGEPAKAVGS